MKFKNLSVIVLIIAFTACSGFSATIGNWFGHSSADANKPAGTGLWKEALWNKDGIKLPPPPATSSDEIKIVRPNTVCTLDSDAGNYQCKLSISGGAEEANAPRLEIVNGAVLGIGEFRVGAGGASATGTIGCVKQSGGTVNLAGNLFVGRFGTSDKNPNNGKGFYTISGGTISCLSENTKAGLYVGAAGSGQTEGTLTIIGTAPELSFKRIYIASEGSNNGTGTIEFRIESKGVSPIKAAEYVSIDAAGANSTAKLIISATGQPPKNNIVLIDNQGSGPVTGIFDTVNGNPAAEGAAVAVDNSNYTLTYKGGQGNNDIVLIYSPAAAEPNKTPAAK